MKDKNFKLIQETLKNNDRTILYFNSAHRVLRLEHDRIVFDFSDRHRIINKEQYDPDIMKYYMLLSDVELKNFYVIKPLFDAS